MLLYCCTISRTLPHSTTSMDGWKVCLPINASIIRLNGTLLTSFLTELKKNCSDDLIIFIVGAKADLQKHRKVTSDLARLRLHEWFPPPKPPTPPPPPPPPKQKKKRVAARKGWKGWVEGSPPPSGKLINLDFVPVLTERKTRSGKSFDAIGVGKDGWV